MMDIVRRCGHTSHDVRVDDVRADLSDGRTVAPTAMHRRRTACVRPALAANLPAPPAGLTRSCLPSLAAQRTKVRRRYEPAPAGALKNSKNCWAAEAMAEAKLGAVQAQLTNMMDGIDHKIMRPQMVRAEKRVWHVCARRAVGQGGFSYG